MQATRPNKPRPGAHIAITGVSHRYRRSTADVLSDINFEVQPCEAVALVGRSGCGKSTLLHIISGLTMPSAGEVRIDGALVEGPSPQWIVMFQQPNLYPWMTVAQNVGLGLKFAGRPRKEIARARARIAASGRARGLRRPQCAGIVRRPAAAHRAGAFAGGLSGSAAARRAVLGARWRHPPRAAARRSPHRG